MRIYADILHIGGMKKSLITAALSLLTIISPGQGKQADISIVFWNLENFFDFVDGGTSDSDAEFSAAGARRWSKRRFYAKCGCIAKTLFYIADEAGGMPDIVCFAEVENAFVLRSLLSTTNLKKYDYETVHYDSPDPRGIDVALLYRKDRLEALETAPAAIPGVVTRDILYAGLRTPEGDSLAVLVNHHPSKFGGKAADPRRRAAVRRMASLADSLSAAGWSSIVSLGDFNDTPDSDIYGPLEGRCINLSAPAAARGEGTIRFNGRWELIDQCFVSPGLAAKADFRICRIPFLTTRDSAHSGEKPLRTYQGPRYLGGVSDHYPILVHIRM